MPTDLEKLKIILVRFGNKFEVLTKTVNQILKENKNYLQTGKAYYLVPVMLLTCCLLDSLRRFNYDSRM